MNYTIFPPVNLAICVEMESKEQVIDTLKWAKKFMLASGCTFVCVAIQQVEGSRSLLAEQIESRLPGGWPSSTALHRWVSPRIPELASESPSGRKGPMFQYRLQWIDHMITEVEKMP